MKNKLDWFLIPETDFAIKSIFRSLDVLGEPTETQVFEVLMDEKDISTVKKDAFEIRDEKNMKVIISKSEVANYCQFFVREGKIAIAVPIEIREARSLLFEKNPVFGSKIVYKLLKQAADVKWARIMVKFAREKYEVAKVKGMSKVSILKFCEKYEKDVPTKSDLKGRDRTLVHELEKFFSVVIEKQRKNSWITIVIKQPA